MRCIRCGHCSQCDAMMHVFVEHDCALQNESQVSHDREYVPVLLKDFGVCAAHVTSLASNCLFVTLGDLNCCPADQFDISEYWADNNGPDVQETKHDELHESDHPPKRSRKLGTQHGRLSIATTLHLTDTDIRLTSCWIADRDRPGLKPIVRGDRMDQPATAIIRNPDNCRAAECLPKAGSTVICEAIED